MIWYNRYMRYLLRIFTIVALVLLAVPTQAATLSERLSGRILLQVESHGEAWYINPENQQRYYMGRPADAFSLMRELGLGITNADLAKIPVSGSSSSGDTRLVNRLRGKILLQVESKGEAWYVHPVDGKRYSLGRPHDAFSLMRTLGLGITTVDLTSISVARDIPPVAQEETTTLDTMPVVEETVQEVAELPGPLAVPSGSALNTPLTQAGIFSETNKHRTQNGLPAFRESQALNQAALKKVQDMAAQQYFEHVSPQGKDVADLAAEVGYEYVTVGENIAVGNTFTDEIVLIEWMNSPGHRANILKPEFTEVGVAAVPGIYQGIEVWYAAQEFGKPQTDCPAIDSQLKTLLDTTQSAVNELEARVNNQQAVLDSYGTIDTSNEALVIEFNEAVALYNVFVADYNDKRDLLIDLVSRYNMQVDAYNKCANI